MQSLDGELHALLAPTLPALKASLAQGIALVQVAESWMAASHRMPRQAVITPEEQRASVTVTSLKRFLSRQPSTGHAAVVLGCVGARW